MNQDTKIGLALALLLLGTVGAFFFRNESGPPEQMLDPVDFDAIDQQIAEKGIFPYLGQNETSGTRPERTDQRTAKNAQSSDTLDFPIPEFLQDSADTPDQPLPEPPPDPIPPDSDSTRTKASAPHPTTAKPKRSTSPVSLGTPAPTPAVASHSTSKITIPKHNNAWQVVDEPAKSSATASRQQMHRVQKGETLSELAQRYLGDSKRFLDIFEANRDLLRDPNDLKAGMEIRIPDRAQPRTGRKPRANHTTPQPNRSHQPARPEASKTSKQANRQFVPVRRTPLNPG